MTEKFWPTVYRTRNTRRR